MGHHDNRPVQLFVPKFTFEDQYDLVEVLQEMGVSDAFDEKRADFCRITGNRDFALSAAIHKTTVDVNEVGCEATSIASFVKRVGATRVREDRRKPIIFKADHPFLFIIYHYPTKAILFVGRVTDPSK